MTDSTDRGRPADDASRDASSAGAREGSTGADGDRRTGTDAGRPSSAGSDAARQADRRSTASRPAPPYNRPQDGAVSQHDPAVDAAQGAANAAQNERAGKPQSASDVAITARLNIIGKATSRAERTHSTFGDQPSGDGARSHDTGSATAGDRDTRPAGDAAASEGAATSAGATDRGAASASPTRPQSQQLWDPPTTPLRRPTDEERQATASHARPSGSSTGAAADPRGPAESRGTVPPAYGERRPDAPTAPAADRGHETPGGHRPSSDAASGASDHRVHADGRPPQRADDRRPANPDLSSFTNTPLGVVETDRLQEARRRTDRTLGIMLLVFGLLATIVNMTIFTENTLALSFAQLYEQYGVSPYVRPDGLGTLAIVGMVGHPLIYAGALYLTLLRWRAGKRAAWIPVLGAVVAMIFSLIIMAIGVSMHPDLLASVAATGGTPPSP